MNNKKHNLSPSSFQAFTQYLNGELKNFAIKTASGVWMDMYGVRLDDTSEPSLGQEPFDYAINQVIRLGATAFIKRDKHVVWRMAIEDREIVEVSSRGAFVKALRDSNFEVDYQEMTFDIKKADIVDYVSLDELKILAIIGDRPSKIENAGEMYMMHDGVEWKVYNFHLYTTSALMDNDLIKVSIEHPITKNINVIEVTDDSTVYVNLAKLFPVVKAVNLSDTKEIIENISKHKGEYLIICNKFVKFDISIKNFEIDSISVTDRYIGPWAKLFISRIPTNKKMYFTEETKWEATNMTN